MDHLIEILLNGIIGFLDLMESGSSGNRTFVYQNGQQLTNQTGWAGATSIATV